MIRIWVKPNRFGKNRWEEIPNGPFPVVTPTVLDEARRLWVAERASKQGQLDQDHSGNTIAREILTKCLPRPMHPTDVLLVAVAITSKEYKTAEE